MNAALFKSSKMTRVFQRLLSQCFIISLGLISAALNAQPMAQIQVFPMAELLTYAQAPRLEQVLLDANALKTTKFDDYAEGYQLFDSNKEPQINQLKQSILTRLTQELTQNRINPEYLQTIIQQLKQNDYGHRLILNLDLDAVRLTPSLNPKLPGNYQLYLTQRPQTIRILGITPASFEFVARQSLSDYLSLITEMPIKYFDRIWLIEPNGTYQNYGVAYWNDQHRYPLPGSLLWLGFASSDPQLIQLEQDIAHLLSMKKGAQ